MTDNDTELEKIISRLEIEEQKFFKMSNEAREEEKTVMEMLSGLRKIALNYVCLLFP